MKWIHISDIHYNPKSDGSYTMMARDNLPKFIKENHIIANHLFVTGDFRHAFKQRKQNEDIVAEDAVDYIISIADSAGIPRENIHVVPGNHDLKRFTKESEKKKLESIRQKYVKDEELFSDEDLAFLYKPFSFYLSVCRKLKEKIPQIDLPWLDQDPMPAVIGYTYDEFSLVCINTCLFCHADDARKKLVADTSSIYREIQKVKRKNPGKPVIFLAHHGLEEIDSVVEKKIETNLQNISAPTLYLCGDAHDLWIRSVNKTLEITTGCLLEGRDVKTLVSMGECTDNSIEYINGYKCERGRWAAYPHFDQEVKRQLNHLSLPVAEAHEKKNKGNARSVSVRHTDLSNLYWVGTRMTDVSNVTPFRGYILFFGDKGSRNSIVMCSEETNIRVDHNDSSDLSQDEFIEQSVDRILKREPDAKFMFYNPSSVYRLGLDEKYGKEHFVCLNNKELLNQVNDKRCFRHMIQNIVPVLPSIERTRADCDYDDLIESLKEGRFEDHNDYGVPVPDIQYDPEPRFIIQAPISSGGAGTFMLSRENARYLLSSLDPRAKYMVSVYYTRNTAVNIHALVEDDRITLLPASIQLEREVEIENKLLYKGADFPAYSQIDADLRKQFEDQARIVSEYLRTLGYRGVLGIDAIIHDGRVNITEVNGRFQASTELINRSLSQSGCKTVHELNYDIFCKGRLSDADRQCRSTVVPYSNYAFSYEGRTFHPDHVYRQAVKSLIENGGKIVADVQRDGYRPDTTAQFCAQAYLFRVVFHNSIASVSEDGTVWINENICGPDRRLSKKIREREKLAVKIALLIQGIRVEDSIRQSLREATNNAVDLQIGSGKELMIINSPTNIRCVEFSPFELRRSQSFTDKYSIYYYDNLLIEPVGIFPADQNQKLRLYDGVKFRHTYSEIAYLSTDRLRVHVTNACLYKLAGKGCEFCNISVEENEVPIGSEDVRTVVEKYMADRSEDMKAGKEVYLRHFLIGGQSLDNCDEQLITTAKVLGDYHMPIYAMTLPLRQETVEELVRRGVYEYAYNIEIFNERCRKKYMPGKSKITVEEYLSALDMTKRMLNKALGSAQNKVVRSMVIVGLEPYNDMLEGIDKLINIHVEPMLSVFRPLPGTSLEYLNAPPIEMVYDLFYVVSKKLFLRSGIRIGEDGKKAPRRFRKLGPECPCCQNNTVSLPWEMQIGKSVYIEWELDQKKTAFAAPIEQ